MAESTEEQIGQPPVDCDSLVGARLWNLLKKEELDFDDEKARRGGEGRSARGTAGAGRV